MFIFFFNLKMPSPKDITEEELVQLLDDEVPDYRIPMSIGEPHAELDKCKKYSSLNELVCDRL